MHRSTVAIDPAAVPTRTYRYSRSINGSIPSGTMYSWCHVHIFVYLLVAVLVEPYHVQPWILSRIHNTQ